MQNKLRNVEKILTYKITSILNSWMNEREKLFCLLFFSYLFWLCFLYFSPFLISSLTRVVLSFIQSHLRFFSLIAPFIKSSFSLFNVFIICKFFSFFYFFVLFYYVLSVIYLCKLFSFIHMKFCSVLIYHSLFLFTSTYSTHITLLGINSKKKKKLACCHSNFASKFLLFL